MPEYKKDDENASIYYPNNEIQKDDLLFSNEEIEMYKLLSNSVAYIKVLNSIYTKELRKVKRKRKLRLTKNIKMTDLVLSVFGLVLGAGLFFASIFRNPIMMVVGLGCIVFGLIHLTWAAK